MCGLVACCVAGHAAVEFFQTIPAACVYIRKYSAGQTTEQEQQKTVTLTKNVISVCM